LVQAHPERMDDGSTLWHGITSDITERKNAEENKRHLEAQLAQAQKLESVGLLAGGVAHDFNNMLSVILGTVELTLMEVDAEQPLHADLQEIRKAAVRSAELTRQLLGFARQQAIAPTVLDLNETLGGMLTLLRRLIGEDIRIVWEPGPALWPVKMDPSQVTQILTNLCVNARHAMVGVGTLHIATANVTTDAAFCAAHAEAVPGDYVRLTVGDTGSGMDAVTLARIFEPFFTTKAAGTGTGLGLAMVYGAVKQNEGFITVASTPGVGTTFEIYLTRHRGASSAGSTDAVAADLRGSETILVVDDEAALARLAARALEAQGYVVLTATDTADALRIASAHPGEIHLLLSDVVMPEMNGRDLAAAIQQVRPGLKLLFMSGYTAGIVASRGILTPELALIEKPFTAASLAAKVREVLDRK
jgi:signal transduction histidine kinase